MRLLPRFSVDRVRTRLLAAFTILLLAGVALAVVGWLGMRSMQRELAGYEEEVLPGIARALQLAERTAQLAAIAPRRWRPTPRWWPACWTTSSGAR
jgi:hypothetical protein